MAEPMSEGRLAEIRARLKAATPGPWVETWSIQSGPIIWAGRDEPLFTSVHGLKHSRVSEEEPEPQWKKDVRFVRCAPSDLAALLAEVDRLRAEVAGLDKALG